MNAIRIETTINSETLYLPQLKPLIGRSVEIIIKESATPRVTPATKDKTAVEAAVLGLQDYDFSAWRESREAEMRIANGKAS